MATMAAAMSLSSGFPTLRARSSTATGARKAGVRPASVRPACVRVHASAARVEAQDDLALGQVGRGREREPRG